MSTKMNKHKGQVVQKTINKLGLKIKEVARQTKISRGTLYNYFKQPDLDNKVLLKLGRVLRYDFSVHFPELIPLKKEFEDEDGLEIYGERTTEELAEIQRKYYKILEKHNTLLKFLVQIAVDYELEDLKEKLSHFKKVQLKDE